MKNVLFATYGYKYPNGDLYNPTIYSYYNKLTGETKTCETRYFFLGLGELLNISFDKIFLFLTEKSRRAYEANIKESISEEILTIINIPEGKTIEEIWKQFDEIVIEGETLSDSNVYLDITNGFRHLPLVLYNSLFYLECLNKINISGIYYGALESVPRGEIVPVFDLTHLGTIIRGSFAVKQFEESGNISGIKDFVNEAIIGNNKENPDRFRIKYEFDKFQSLYAAGLPLEAGIEAKNLIYKLNKRFPKSGINATDVLMNRVYERLNNVAVNTDPKTNISLTYEELDRSLNFIKWELDTQNISNALLLLREWVISRVMLASDEKGNWINNDKRERIEFLLGYYSFNHNSFKEHIGYEFIHSWRFLADYRNEYAHCGYRAKSINIDDDLKKAKEYYELCSTNKYNDDFWKLPVKMSGKGSVLITPMGASSGLLFTALSLVKADSIIVLTSEKFIPKVNEACSKAGLKDMSKVHILTIKDAFCGFNEANEIYKQMTDFIKNPEEININLTGGTTAMQWAMQTAYEKLLKGNLNVKRIAFVDRRPSVEQQANPYILGERLDVDELINKR